MIDPLDTVPALLLTVEQAARSLGLGRSKFYQLMTKGDIPSVRIGGSRRIRMADLEAYVARLDREDHEATA